MVRGQGVEGKGWCRGMAWWPGSELPVVSWQRAPLPNGLAASSPHSPVAWYGMAASHSPLPARWPDRCQVSSPLAAWRWCVMGARVTGELSGGRRGGCVRCVRGGCSPVTGGACQASPLAARSHWANEPLVHCVCTSIRDFPCIRVPYIRVRPCVRVGIAWCRRRHGLGMPGSAQALT
jgi:hypothetical protein